MRLDGGQRLGPKHSSAYVSRPPARPRRKREPCVAQLVCSLFVPRAQLARSAYVWARRSLRRRAAEDIVPGDKPQAGGTGRRLLRRGTSQRVACCHAFLHAASTLNEVRTRQALLSLVNLG